MLKKSGYYLLALAAIVAGLLIGTLNANPVSLDLLWVRFELPLGLALLLGFSLGFVSGVSMIFLTRVLPLRLQLRKAKALNTRQDSQGPSTPDD